MKQLLVFVVAVMLSNILVASNYEKEKRWASQIEDGLMDGESAELKAGDINFYSIYTEADDPKDTAILLLHGLGVHPDWPQVINPLRVELPALGWSTLSIQLPVLENGKPGKDYLPLYKDVPPRIHAALNELKSKGAKKVIIIAHSLGAEMAAYTLQDSTDNVDGFIGIGMGPDNVQYLPKIKLPVLDLYGEEDLEDVVKSAGKRAKSGSDNKQYQQKEIKGVDHFFNDADEVLINAVTEWLKSLSS